MEDLLFGELLVDHRVVNLLGLESWKDCRSSMRCIEPLLYRPPGCRHHPFPSGLDIEFNITIIMKNFLSFFDASMREGVTVTLAGPMSSPPVVAGYARGLPWHTWL